MPEIELTTKGKPHSLKLNPEAPYLSITGVEKFDGEALKTMDYRLEYNLKGDNGKSSKGTVGLYGLVDRKEHVLIPSDSEYNNVTLSLLSNRDEGREVRLTYETIEKFDISNPIDKFESHLTNERNTKILFSSPFGQGKTTFLNLYFDERKDDYEVYNVFPINYSVANNTDIFKYIKTDILFQLLQSLNVEFEKQESDHQVELSDFLKKNLQKVLAPFLMAIPLIGKSSYSIFNSAIVTL